MIAGLTLLPKSTLKLSFTRPYHLNSYRPTTSRLRLSARKSSDLGGGAAKRAVISSNIMPKEIENSSAINSWGSNEEKSIGVLDQEAFIKESTEFQALSISSSGLEATLNSMSKWLASAAFGVFFLWRHDAEAMWVVTGAVLNAILSVALKRILNQERPFPTPKSDPGMPSSHAQSLFYIVAFGVLATVEWLGVNGVSVILSSLLLASGSYFSWLRVSQKLHTVSQVVVGAIVGASFSSLWYWLWNEFVLQAFISSIWVRLAVVLGALVFCVSFVVYIINHWLNDD
ncbi:Lipid phosphate phosphatase epsilon 2, chloroplastic [Linum grandiflorum]